MGKMMEAAELALRETLMRGATEAEAYIRRVKKLEIGFAERMFDESPTVGCYDDNTAKLQPEDVVESIQSAIGEIEGCGERGKYIEETIGEWLSNPISGQLKATITHGYLIKDGELRRPVKGVVLTGDFHQLLLECIDLIGHDQANTRGSYSPSVRVRGLAIAGE